MTASHPQYFIVTDSISPHSNSQQLTAIHCDEPNTGFEPRLISAHFLPAALVGGYGIKMKYTPNPMQTNDITLSDDLVALTELIAANVHDVWAVGRIKEGWTYGEVKDTEKKTTPCLVPYDELPESEKEYDRNTAIETLKLITKLGYKITRKDIEA